MRRPPSAALLHWLDGRRWFALRPSGQADLEITEVGETAVADGLDVAWWVLRVSGTGPVRDAAATEWLLPMACCRGGAPVGDAISIGQHSWFDALSHPATASAAIDVLRSGSRPNVEFVSLDDGPLALTGLSTAGLDQSNTSLHTTDHVLKVFRRLWPGRNPEIEIGAALRAAGSTQVAGLQGWASLSIEQTSYDVLAVHRRVPGTDGFTLAVADARRFARGENELHFPGAAYELGIALGALHADLVTAFGTKEVSDLGARLSARLLGRLDAIRDLEVLQPFLPAAAAMFGELAAANLRIPVQRIHGDLHLGQTLFAPDGWRLIDFEGEPRRPLAERVAPDTVLRDLAGVLRSFDYAARWDHATGRAAGDWWSRTTAMFLEGYHLQHPDAVHRDVLDALLLDKALYEVGYETAYRPERVRIPLAAVAALCGGS